MGELLDFYKGMDLSFLQQCQEEGMVLRDFDGAPRDPLLLAKECGVNAVRLRLWNSPEHVPESGGYCSLPRTLEMGRKIKEAGLDFLLDFHYSDYWADPAQQRKPKDWEGLSQEELEQAVFRFTRDSLLTLKEGGAMPDMVQIGNEIRSGMLFPNGEAPDFRGLARLVNAGIRGARAAGGPGLQVMIHLDQGGRYFYLEEWFDRAMENGLEDFDVIGLSYYPFWHGTFADLKESMEKLAARYRKPIILAETAYAWRITPQGFIDRAQERIAGFPASPEGQRRVLELVMNISASLPGRMGRGIFYWEPFCVPRSGVGGWAENMGLLREDGSLMEGMRAFSFTRGQYRGGRTAKVYQPEELTAPVGGEISLPAQVRVLHFDGTLHSLPVAWENGGETACARPGRRLFQGRAEGLEEPVRLWVTVQERAPQAENLLQDPNWDEGFVRWDMEKSGVDVAAELRPEFVDPFPAPPRNTLRVESRRNFRFSLSQCVPVQPGRYRLEAEYQGADTTNVDVKLFLEGCGSRAEAVVHPTEHEWQRIAVELEAEAPGVLRAGLRISSPPVYGCVRRFALRRAEEKEE